MAKFHWRDASNNSPNVDSIVIIKNIIPIDRFGKPLPTDKPSYCICLYDGYEYYSIETKYRQYPECWDYVEDRSWLLNTITNFKLPTSDKLGALPA